ncbi:MAG TPA: nuclear transport factor 2 family protein [Eudoraea sp.]|nr:nuclear transport factor 2 family protein [Eudoraea sp.]
MKIEVTCNPYFYVSKQSRLIFMALLLASFPLSARDKTGPYFNDPEELVRHLYEQVTFPAGQTPDWDHVRTLIIKESTVVMRVAKGETATLSLEGWIQDFVNFIEEADVKTTGFEEKIVTLKSMVFGDIAHLLVLYTSYIPGKSRAPREGVDSFHLIRKDGQWQIVSILNEIPTPDRPTPETLH